MSGVEANLIGGDIDCLSLKVLVINILWIMYEYRVRYLLKYKNKKALNKKKSLWKNEIYSI